jgi:hypothetical protein
VTGSGEEVPEAGSSRSGRFTPRQGDLGIVAARTARRPALPPERGPLIAGDVVDDRIPPGSTMELLADHLGLGLVPGLEP